MTSATELTHLRGGGGCQCPGARDPGGRGTQPTQPASPPRGLRLCCYQSRAGRLEDRCPEGWVPYSIRQDNN